jgi:hypothetical protein
MAGLHTAPTEAAPASGARTIEPDTPTTLNMATINTPASAREVNRDRCGLRELSAAFVMGFGPPPD